MTFAAGSLVERPHVAVIGPGAGSSSVAVEAVAFDVGALLAGAGAVLVCGGLGGVMEAACRGTRSAGGVSIGILPGSDRAAANAFVDVAVPTGLGELRNGLVVRSVDAVIAVGGAFGTLSEIALALKAGKRVIGVHTWELVRDGRTDASIVVVASASEAVRRALARD